MNKRGKSKNVREGGKQRTKEKEENEKYIQSRKTEQENKGSVKKWAASLC